MVAYQSFYEKYKDVANIYIVYILEAHFVEKDENNNFIGGWPVGYQYNYPQPKTMDERFSMVKLLMDEYHPTIPILVDKINNNFQNIYNPWPDSAYVYKNNKLIYVSNANDDGSRDTYWTNEISEML